MTVSTDYNVLVVEDSKTIRRIYQTHFENSEPLKKIKVETVESAEAAITHISNHTCHLILLDWRLPGMSGLEFLKLLRSKPETREIKVIMVTSMGDKSNVVSAAKLGISEYIVKPVKKETLIEKISNCLSLNS